MWGNRCDSIQHQILVCFTHREMIKLHVLLQKKIEYFQNVYFSQSASWLLLLPCPDGVKVQLNLVASWEMSLSSLAGKSKLPGREIKIISWIWVCLQKPSTQKPARWLLGCPPAQMCQHTWSLANSSPQALLCTPHPLRKTRSRSLAPKLQNSRPDVGWVCSCYKFLHIKKKKKVMYMSRWQSLLFHWWLLLQSSWLGCWKGQQAPLPCGSGKGPSLQTQARRPQCQSPQM